MNTGVQNHVIRQDSHEIEISIVMWINAFGNGFGFLGLRYLRWNINVFYMQKIYIDYIQKVHKKGKKRIIFSFPCLLLGI